MVGSNRTCTIHADKKPHRNKKKKKKNFELVASKTFIVTMLKQWDGWLSCFRNTELLLLKLLIFNTNETIAIINENQNYSKKAKKSCTCIK